MEAIESMDIDGQKVILHLSDYSSNLFVTLAGQMYNIQDKGVLDSTSDDDLLWGAKPYGMYYLDEYVEGSHVVLKRNDYYKTYNPYVENKGPGYYAEITVRFITEEFSRATALNVGDIDALFEISADGLSQITREDAKAITQRGTPNVSYIALNMASEPFADIRVRQAIAYAIDRDKIEKDTEGLAVPAYSLATEGVISMNQGFADWYQSEYGTDPGKAAQLLEEAGWKDSDGDGYVDKDGKALQLVVVGPDYNALTIVAQSLQNQLKEIGVKLDLETYSDGYHYDVISQGKYDIGIESFGWMEPSTLFMYALVDDPNGLAIPGIEEEYYALADACQHEPDGDKRSEIIAEMEHLLADNMIAIPICSLFSTMVVTDGFDGIVTMPSGNTYYNDIKANK